ncbi:hypothetical protein [Dasania marina]|uniref:hypothetical protein n=1 Tax=Dasania marina TaxID=471499 RepID=UPI00038095E6|nr:hypothetical protein [Dasania marina]
MEYKNIQYLVAFLGEEVTDELSVYLIENIDSPVNPAVLWAFIDEKKHQYLNAFVEDESLFFRSKACNTWRKLAEFGKRWRVHFENKLMERGMFSDFEYPDEYKYLYSLINVAYFCDSIKSHLTNIRVDVNKYNRTEGVCNLCWREIEPGKDKNCSIHKNGTASYKRALRGKDLYTETLTKLRISYQTETLHSLLIEVRKFADNEGLTVFEKELILEKLDSRPSASYSDNSILNKEIKLFPKIPVEVENIKFIKIAILLRAEAFLRSERAVRSNSGGKRVGAGRKKF